MSGLVGMFGHALSCFQLSKWASRSEREARCAGAMGWDGVGLMSPERGVPVGLAAAEPIRAGCCCVLQVVSRLISAFQVPSLHSSCDEDSDVAIECWDRSAALVESRSVSRERVDTLMMYVIQSNAPGHVPSAGECQR